MGQQSFTFSGDQTLSQISSAGKVIFRSTSASDTGNAIILGAVSSTATKETLTMTGLFEVLSSNTFDASGLTSVSLSAVAAGTITMLAPGTAAEGDVRINTNPSDGDTLTIALGANSTVYRFKTTTAQANDIKIGANAAATAANLDAAINADGSGDGTDYHAGTAAHPYVSSTVATDVVSLTDRIACARGQTWSITESGSNFSIRPMVGGVDGSTLTTFAIGESLAIVSAFTLSDSALTSDLLPALFTGKSNVIQTGGSRGTLYLAAGTLGSNITVTLEESVDSGATWYDSGETISNLTSDSRQRIPIPYEVSHVRLSVDTNANTAAESVDARFVYS